MNRVLFLKYYRAYPAGFVLLGILTALIPLNIGHSFLWIILSAVCISAIIVYALSYRLSLLYILWVLIGIIAFYINLTLMQTEKEAFSLKKGLYSDIKFETIDNSLTVENISWLEMPKNIFISLSEIKKEETGVWENCSGKLYFQNKNSYKFSYGKSYEASGTILPAERVLNKTFSDYLKSIGVLYVFYPKSVKEAEMENSWWAALTLPIIQFRDKILKRCVEGISDVSIKEFLAGILFGFRQGLDFETRNKFLETGTIHIIAISGSHIGILALLFLFLLKPFPIRVRYFSVPIILLIYIIAIGYLHSAVRAFIMVSIFFLLKGSLRVSNSFNVLFFTCAIMLILNPYSLLNPGFQFSFVIVLFLMLGWKVSYELRNCFAEKYFWIPKKRVGYSISLKGKALEKVVLGISATLIAGLASIPMQLLFNGIVTPIMPISNILVLPLMFPLFLVSIIKVIFLGFIPSLVSVDLLGFILRGLVNAIFGIVNISYETDLSFYLRVPNIMGIIFFYLTLIAVLMLFNKKVLSFLLSMTLIAIALFIIITPKFYSDRIVFLKIPGSDACSAILLDNSQSLATIINCPQRSYFEIENILKKEGMNGIERVFITKGDNASSGDAIKLLENYKGKVKGVIIEETLRNTKLVRDIKLFCKNNRICLDSFQSQKSGAGISFLNKGRQISLSIKSEENYKINSTILVDNQKIETVKFKNNNEVQTVWMDL